MPTIEETVDGILVTLDENAVIIAGIRADTDTARNTANQAVINIADARVDVRSYTDQRIQYVLDFITTTLTDWAASIIATAGGYSDSVGTNVTNDINNTWEEWQALVDETIADILADYNEISAWAEGAYTTTIPALIAEVAAITERANQLEQDILNEVGTARQETAEMADRWRSIADAVQENINRIVEMDFSIYEIKDQIYQNISVEFDDRFATFDSKINVAVGEVGAVATRVDTLEVDMGEQQAKVQTLEIALVSETEALAQQITALSVGTQTQFDSFRIWHFDANRENWSGTWNDGYLVVADTTQSPNSLGVNANLYRQVRMRLRREGTPTWAGSLDWTGATPAGPQAIPEPAWVDNRGEVTVNLDWSGTLQQLILTLTSGSDASNRILVDWITVGRPAPGVSSAELLGERTARIDADSAMAQRLDTIELAFSTGDGVIGVATDVVEGVRSEIIEDAVTGAVSAVNSSITAFDTRVTNVETGQTVNSNALSLLTNRVDVTEDGITSVNSRVDLLEIELDGLGSSSAFAALTQRMEDIEGAMTLTNSDIVSLNSSISTVEGDVSAAQAAADVANALAGSKGRVFVQNAEPPVDQRSAVNLWIDTTAGANTPKRWDGSSWEPVTDKVARDAAEAAANALAGLGDKADSSALTALTNRVSTAEGLITSSASSITTLESNLDLVSGSATNAASAAQDALTAAGSKGRVYFQSSAPPIAARLAQNLWIDTNGGNNTPKRWNGSAWVAVTDKVATNAAAAAADALAQVATKASSTALNSLTTRVEETENGITAIGESIERLDSSIETQTTDIGAVRTAAENAATLAGSKGKVFYQSTAPIAAERLAQNLWIDTNNGANTPKRWNGTTWAAVSDKIAVDAAAAAARAESALSTKAETSAVTAVTNRVSTVEGNVTAVTSRVSTVESRLNNGTTGLSALSSGISSLRTSVNNIGETVTAQGESISGVSTRVNRTSASGLLRAVSWASPSGARARIGLYCMATSEDTSSQSPGIFLTAGTDGTNDCMVVANRFSIVQNTTTDSDPIVPFWVRDGVTYMKTALIENATVGTLKLGNNSATINWSASGNGVWVRPDYPCRLIIFTSARIMGTYSKHTTIYRLYRDGNAIASQAFSVNEYTYPYTNIHTHSVAAGDYYYKFDFARSDAGEATQDNSHRIAVFGAYK